MYGFESTLVGTRLSIGFFRFIKSIVGLRFPEARASLSEAVKAHIRIFGLLHEDVSQSAERHRNLVVFSCKTQQQHTI